MLVGAAVDPGALDEKRYAETLAREFDFVTPENHLKWARVHPAPDKWDFAAADKIVDFAERHRMKIKGHALVWHETLPDCLNEKMTGDELRAAMRDHITTLVKRYKHRIVAWDVVNEAIDDAGFYRDSLFHKRIGPGYIAEAFHIAHQATPYSAKIYNDYGGEGLGGKSDRIYELLKKLRSDGVPIHGVGLQMHLEADKVPPVVDIRRNLRRLAGLGLKIYISEMDVQVGMLPDDPARFQRQKEIYRDVLAACLSEPAVVAVSFWGFTDAHSWKHTPREKQYPLLFDEVYRPKPAYDGVLDALGSMVTRGPAP